MTPTLPNVDPEQFLTLPFKERMKLLITFWVDNGGGTEKIVHVIYILRIVFFYALCGVGLAVLTSGVGSLWDPRSWWNEPIVYQKLVLWTVLVEVLGIGGSWGPLAGHYKPMSGGFRFWFRPGTIRLPPWPRVVPLTRGDRRTVVDVLFYAALLLSLMAGVVFPGTDGDVVSTRPDTTGGMVRPELLVVPVVLLVLLGLRDKTLFLAARGEQYLPVLVLSATLGFVDLIIALKIVIVIVWVGASVSKLGLHFCNVVPPMVSNAPAIPARLRRLHYRSFPDDLLPSRLAWFMGHVLGTLAEMVVPLVLLFSENRTLTLVGVGCMVLFHLFILSSFPLAVPLEWNVLFSYAAIFLFAGFPAQDGYSVFDFSKPWLLALILLGLLFFPVLGNFRPDLVSFLPSMRQYAGNWASAVWAFAPGAEDRLTELGKPVVNQIDQLRQLGYDTDVATMLLQLSQAWRLMHSQGRGLFSVLQVQLGDDFETYTLREAEDTCSTVIGWNFGDGHLHDDQLINAIQRRLHFQPGELVVVWVESQAIHKSYQEYFVMDAALGIIERGRWRVKDAVSEQPWLPNGPIPFEVTWRSSSNGDDAQRGLDGSLA